ncbi:hypothetical protein F2Q70_00041880 [Brassica cretica]|uniref:Transmembrane 9 superfamily member n=1 Tax=Brassica cretica TaxID=69181 RepID=A0A8S9K6Z9_BRACR|nr:hypothetical protein F2Q70_00041880 [Brassica cretica]
MPSSTGAVLLLLVSLLATALASDSDHKVRVGSPLPEMHFQFLIHSSKSSTVTVDLVILIAFERDVNEESGWKLVHGDVFRPPWSLVLLSAVVGTGAQLALLVLLVILMAIVGTLYVGRGAIVTTFIVCYALTSFISGYVSGGMYSRSGGKHWIKCMVLTASLFPFLCFGIGFLLNTIAIFYGSLAAIPFGTMVVVFVIWGFISFPLALLGTVVGRNWSGAPNNPCRVKTIPRPIPEKKWYLTPSVVSLMGGLLPFGSIFIEMYFVFTSFWNYKVYYVYGFMLLVFVILVIVTVCVTIVGTYFLLNAENYHWQWTSFFSAASTAVYVYLYSIYYYYVKTKMSGFFQTSYYFGYTMMFCLGLGILCGAVGFLGSNLFIHWFSIFNSFMMVIFLTGLVSMILMRTLRNDYAKYAREDDDLESLERDVNEESGWKLVHGDVFRPPWSLVLLSAVVGTGAQLALLVLLVILMAIVGTLYVGRGAIVTTFIVCYALTSFISGYVSGGMYSRSGGKHWIKCMVLTASLFPFLCFGIGFFLNTIAIFYGSLAAIPFGTMVVVFVIWGFISFPLALLGTVVGRNWSGAPNNPCRVKTIPRPIPEKKWYLTPSVVSLMGGLLPFGSIFIEMYFVFTSFWNYKVYYVYGFMLLVFVILVIVTVCVTIVGTYFLLNAENYHWQWTSFFSAASTAVYVYLYSIYYYYVKTKMSGFFQTSFYFGYTMMFCLGLGILCGAVGFLGSNLFVRRIYRNIKCD